MQLAASLTGTRLVACAVACSAVFALYRVWPAAEEPAPRSSRAATYSYVPLLGDPTWSIEASQRAHGAGCAPFVTPLTAHSHWSLTLADGGSGCTGDYIPNTYDVFSDGSMLWHAIGMPDRVLHLTAPELDLITRVNAFPCGRTEPIGYSVGWIRIAPTDDDPRARGAAEVPSSSLAGGMLESVLQGAVARYQTERLAAIGPFELRLAAKIGHARYRFDLDVHGHFVVHRGKKVMVDQALDDAERVEIYDLLTTRIGAERDDAWQPVVRGSLVAAGAALPISLTEWEDQQFRVLWRSVAVASELESSR